MPSRLLLGLYDCIVSIAVVGQHIEIKAATATIPMPRVGSSDRDSPIVGTYPQGYECTPTCSGSPIQTCADSYVRSCCPVSKYRVLALRIPNEQDIARGGR